MTSCIVLDIDKSGSDVATLSRVWELGYATGCAQRVDSVPSASRVRFMKRDEALQSAKDRFLKTAAGIAM